MSWTHFTSYLDGTRPITTAERDELYDQLAAKFTDCGDLFELNATNQTAIKDSNLLTDMASITEVGPSTVTSDNLGAIIIAAGPYGDLTGYEILQQAGTAEGLSSGEFDELFDSFGRVVSLDHYRVWNIYKRAIDLLVCVAPDPTLACRTASASKTKCGFDEFGTPSSPPKVYRTKTQAGAITDSYDPAGPNEQTNIVTWSGALTYARPACTTTDTRALSIRSIVGSNVGGPCDATKNASGSSVRMDEAGDGSSPDPRGCYLWGTNCAGTTMDALQGCCSAATATSTTVATFATTSCASFVGGTVSGTDATLTLSDEYTTVELEADVDAALPAFSGGYSSGACSDGAFFDISTDERTITKRAMEYLFELPDLTGHVCYRIDWEEVFTPEGGGSPTVTPKFYNWDGVATETPAYTIDPPATQGTTTVENVAVSFDC